MLDDPVRSPEWKEANEAQPTNLRVGGVCVVRALLRRPRRRTGRSVWGQAERPVH